MSISEVIPIEKSFHLLESSYDEKDVSSEISEFPKWLTKDYIETVLREYYKDEAIKVLDMEIRCALGKGDNYAGVLTRAEVEFIGNCTGNSRQKGFYIIKSSFEGDEFACNVMEPYDIFNRELCIYEKVLPKLKCLLKEVNDEEEIFVETIKVDYKNSAIIFEDLNARGFRMPNRIEGVDKKLAKLVLRKIAKMHAASAVLNEKENHSLESYDKGMFNRHTENYAPCFLGFLDASVRCLLQWNETKYAKLAQKLVELRTNYMELAKRVFDPTPGFLNVLAHGDLWTNNLLVKYDEKTGEPLDVLIIDFQYTAWGSPAIDLFYFFNTSLQDETHICDQAELIKFYYDVLAETLRKFNFKSYLPSLHKFIMEIESKEFYAFHSACVVSAIVRNEYTDDADFHALMETNERAIKFKDTCYKNKHIQENLRRLLPFYEKRGILEIDQ